MTVGKSVFPATKQNSRDEKSYALKHSALFIDTVRLAFYFWAEAVSIVHFIRNRYPSKCLDGKIPYEVWIGKTSNMSEFRDFQCKVFCLNREPSKRKFDLRCKKDKFLAYSDETLRFWIWLPVGRKIIITRDFKFLENTRSSDEEFK